MGLTGLLRKVKIREHEIKILFIGLENSGKSSIINVFLEKPLDEITPTQGFNIFNIKKNDYSISIWDITGAQATRSSWHSFFDGCDGIVFVIDGSDKTRFEEAKKELDAALAKDRANAFTWLVLVNKQDLPGCALAQDISGAFNIHQHSQKRLNVMECSAIKREGVVEAMNWLLNDIVTKTFQ